LDPKNITGRASLTLERQDSRVREPGW